MYAGLQAGRPFNFIFRHVGEKLWPLCKCVQCQRSAELCADVPENKIERPAGLLVSIADRVDRMNTANEIIMNAMVEMEAKHRVAGGVPRTLEEVKAAFEALTAGKEAAIEAEAQRRYRAVIAAAQNKAEYDAMLRELLPHL